MRDFNKLCKYVESLDPITYSEIIAIKSVSILPALIEYTKDENLAYEQFSMFILGAIASDGKLALEEYISCEPLIKSFFGDHLDYEKTKDLVNKMKDEMSELKDTVDKMVDMYGELKPELKEDIIIICLMLCSIDGKVTPKEKKWIKQLIK